MMQAKQKGRGAESSKKVVGIAICGDGRERGGRERRQMHATPVQFHINSSHLLLSHLFRIYIHLREQCWLHVELFFVISSCVR